MADDHPDDVDAIIEDPIGEIVWYYNRDSDLMHLDRDDRGVFADQINVDGYFMPMLLTKRPLHCEHPCRPVCSEPTPLPGQLHETAASHGQGRKLNPVVTVVYYEEHELDGVGDELTAVRFTLDAEGSVTSTNQLPSHCSLRLGKKPKWPSRSDYSRPMC